MSSQRWKDENRDKQRGYQRKYYLANKGKVIAETAARKIKTKAWVDGLKATLKCVLCPENNFVCLDFHHTDPDVKERSISSAVLNGWSKKRILEEMKKCIVICSNCHRKVHAGKMRV